MRKLSGDVYGGRQTNIQKSVEVVIKIAKSSRDANALACEYQILQDLHNCSRIPKALWLGWEGKLDVLVLERLGPSLADRFRECGQKFSFNTVILIAAQLVS